MKSNVDDPDYVPSGLDRLELQRPSTPLLRSECHHPHGSCSAGQGIVFRSRITPSPSRSGRRNSRTSETSSTQHGEDTPENSQKSVVTEEKTSSTSHCHKSRIVRRLWTSDYSSDSDENNQNCTPKKSQSSGAPLGSPRLRAFDGTDWIQSPRTGYTYIDSPTYRNTWTPEREVPMPNMARLRLYDYNDGEVSFTLKQKLSFEETRLKLKERGQKDFEPKRWSQLLSFGRIIFLVLLPLTIFIKSLENFCKITQTLFRQVSKLACATWTSSHLAMLGVVNYSKVFIRRYIGQRIISDPTDLTSEPCSDETTLLQRSILKCYSFLSLTRATTSKLSRFTFSNLVNAVQSTSGIGRLSTPETESAESISSGDESDSHQSTELSTFQSYSLFQRFWDFWTRITFKSDDVYYSRRWPRKSGKYPSRRSLRLQGLDAEYLGYSASRKRRSRAAKQQQQSFSSLNDSFSESEQSGDSDSESEKDVSSSLTKRRLSYWIWDMAADYSSPSHANKRKNSRSMENSSRSSLRLRGVDAEFDGILESHHRRKRRSTTCNSIADMDSESCENNSSWLLIFSSLWNGLFLSRLSQPSDSNLERRSPISDYCTTDSSEPEDGNIEDAEKVTDGSRISRVLHWIWGKTAGPSRPRRRCRTRRSATEPVRSSVRLKERNFVSEETAISTSDDNPTTSNDQIIGHQCDSRPQPFWWPWSMSSSQHSCRKYARRKVNSDPTRSSLRLRGMNAKKSMEFSLPEGQDTESETDSVQEEENKDQKSFISQTCCWIWYILAYFSLKRLFKTAETIKGSPTFERPIFKSPKECLLPEDVSETHLDQCPNGVDSDYGSYTSRGSEPTKDFHLKVQEVARFDNFKAFASALLVFPWNLFLKLSLLTFETIKKPLFGILSTATKVSVSSGSTLQLCGSKIFSRIISKIDHLTTRFKHLAIDKVFRTSKESLENSNSKQESECSSSGRRQVSRRMFPGCCQTKMIFGLLMLLLIVSGLFVSFQSPVDEDVKGSRLHKLANSVFNVMKDAISFTTSGIKEIPFVMENMNWMKRTFFSSISILEEVSFAFARLLRLLMSSLGFALTFLTNHFISTPTSSLPNDLSAKVIEEILKNPDFLGAFGDLIRDRMLEEKNHQNEAVERLTSRIESGYLKESMDLEALLKQMDTEQGSVREKLRANDLADLQTMLTSLNNNLRQTTDIGGLEQNFKGLVDEINKMEHKVAKLRVEVQSCCLNQTYINELVEKNVKLFRTKCESDWKDYLKIAKVEFDSQIYNSKIDLKTQILQAVTSNFTKFQAEEVDNVLQEVLLQANSYNYSNTTGSPVFNRFEIEALIQRAIATYDADKTGLFDFALESAGGSVVSTRCTESYLRYEATYTLFGIPVWWKSNNPRVAIQPGVTPGQCWAFKGSQGFLVIQLSTPMRPTRFSLEHIPRSMSPTGKIDSAPKEFEVYGYLYNEDEQEPVFLGKYLYDHNGDPLQFFYIMQPVEDIFYFIELRILSNHGNPNYTCLYRFRVHGNR